MTTPDTTRWRALLLDDLGDEDRDVVEARMFLEPGVDDAIALAEDDLIADYVDGRLSPSARLRFERVYLASPRHRGRVDAVRLLRLQAHVRPPARFPWWLAAAAAVVILAAGSLLLRPRHSPATTSVSTTPAPATPVPAPAPLVATLVLTPPVSRGDGAVRTLVRPEGVAVIRLAAPFARDAVGARIEAVDTPAAPVSVTARPLESGGVALDVPAARIAAGDYAITFLDARGRTVARTAFRIE